ncbi:24846_t:CDS:1, partial [Racocetra persica]
CREQIKVDGMRIRKANGNKANKVDICGKGETRNIIKDESGVFSTKSRSKK